MSWKRVGSCLLCGKDRCLEKNDEPGVGYCFRFGTMHRNGKGFSKKTPEGFLEDRRGEFRHKPKEGKKEKAFYEKGFLSSPQIKFDFEG